MSVLLVTDEQEQVGSLGFHCTRFSGGGGACTDRPSIRLPSDSLMLKSHQRVVFRTVFNLDPVSLTISVHKIENEFGEDVATEGILFNSFEHDEAYSEGVSGTKLSQFR